MGSICYKVIPMQSPSEPLETAQLQAFTRIVEARSLTRAAMELRVPRATLGRRLARLEQRLGVRLLKRTTRRLSLTDAGQSLYQHARSVLDAAARAEASVQRGDGALQGDLRISVPPAFSERLNDLVVAFACEHPGVRVLVHASTQHADLVGGSYDVALRASQHLEPGLVARTLARLTLVAVASPAYVKAHGSPRTTADLATHRCLMLFQRGEIPETHWPLRTGKRLRVTGAFFANDPVLLASAARAGLGIALLPSPVVRAELDAGALIAVLPKALGVEARLSVVFAERELLPPHVRAFIDALTRWGPTALIDARGAAPAPRARAPSRP